MIDLKKITTEILIDQLEYIKLKPAEERVHQECRLVLDIWKACEIEAYHDKITDLSHIPDADLEQMARKNK